METQVFKKLQARGEAECRRFFEDRRNEVSIFLPRASSVRYFPYVTMNCSSLTCILLKKNHQNCRSSTRAGKQCRKDHVQCLPHGQDNAEWISRRMGTNKPLEHQNFNFHMSKVTTKFNVKGLSIFAFQVERALTYPAPRRAIGGYGPSRGSFSPDFSETTGPVKNSVQTVSQGSYHVIQVN